jgi:hypothetical protein
MTPTLAALTNGRVVEIITSPSGRPVKVPVALWDKTPDGRYYICQDSWDKHNPISAMSITETLTRFRDARFPDHPIDPSSL